MFTCCKEDSSVKTYDFGPKSCVALSTKITANDAARGHFAEG